MFYLQTQNCAEVLSHPLFFIFSLKCIRFERGISKWSWSKVFHAFRIFSCSMFTALFSPLSNTYFNLKSSKPIQKIEILSTKQKHVSFKMHSMNSIWNFCLQQIKKRNYLNHQTVIFDIFIVSTEEIRKNLLLFFN